MANFEYLIINQFPGNIPEFGIEWVSLGRDLSCGRGIGLAFRRVMQVHVRRNPPLNARASAIRMQAPMKPAIK